MNEVGLPDSSEPEAADDFLAAFPPDATANGYVTTIGERVWCKRLSDGKSYEGRVEENRFGLFIHTDTGERVVLAACKWAVGPLRSLRVAP